MLKTSCTTHVLPSSCIYQNLVTCVHEQWDIHHSTCVKSRWFRSTYYKNMNHQIRSSERTTNFSFTTQALSQQRKSTKSWTFSLYHAQLRYCQIEQRCMKLKIIHLPHVIFPELTYWPYTSITRKYFLQFEKERRKLPWAVSPLRPGSTSTTFSLTVIGSSKSITCNRDNAAQWDG